MVTTVPVHPKSGIVPVKMTQQQRAERRKEIAKYVQSGHTLFEACMKFDVSMHTVRNACDENDVDCPRSTIADRTYEIIAALVLERGTLEYFGEKFSLSKQRISVIRQNCVRAGIPLGIGNKLTVHPLKKVD